MRAITILAAIALVAIVFGAQSVPEATASNTIAKREGLACTSCHDKPGSKLLTDRGKYYELTLSLEGYDELQATFSKCTTCHVRKPGSLKLTKQGRQFREMLNDMDGLRALLLGHHQAAGAEGETPEAPPTPCLLAGSSDGESRRE